MSVVAPLLDRLTIDFSSNFTRPNAIGGYIDQLCNDLELVFNSAGLGSMYELHNHPQVACSVLNYGMGSFAGVTVSSIDLVQLERRVRRLIRVFEPRILSRSLDVVLLPNDEVNSGFKFLLRGEVCARGSQYSFALHSTWNTESGEVCVRPCGKHYG
ncbi:type VI secretion system baseplate subunit TssE [Pseudomonas sp. NPDC079086]|jgi:type VI secretion system protein ImpF|uniref:type VI secretion system baseplate subunit TssE n=1 Tax=unclassified Pseudomonas TaxID=196821 RepID=UPI0037CBEFBD